MKYAIITDDCVAQLYGKALTAHLQERELEAELFSFPAGECSKTRATKEKLEDALFEAGFNRDTTIVALGGGVVCDLAGFLAATFCRGVDLVLIPTTLLAMVDAAIGGKTGVNTDLGKNLIGAFYFPQQIVMDFRFLQTLPEKELWNGTVEILKAGLIADADLFLNFGSLSWKTRIERAIEIKRRIIAQDPDERGVRRLLNLGHTVGHAIETVLDYQISHGEAVAIGIVLEARISQRLGQLEGESLIEIEKRFPPVSLKLDLDALFKALVLDKKVKGKALYFALLKEIGSAAIFEVPIAVIEEVVCAVCPC